MKKIRSVKSTALITVRKMTGAAMLCAMSIVIGMFCKSYLNFGMGLFRITFENIPIIVSGIMFGPLVGALVGASSDLISYLLSPQIYPPNLIVTLGATCIGIVSGVLSRYVFKKRTVAELILTVFISHVIGSMIIKTVGLYSYYGYLVIWRVPLYVFISALETAVICLLYKNPSFKKLFNSDNS